MISLNPNELHIAAANNDLSKVQQLISQGANVHLRNDNDFTPLYYAATRNEYESHLKVIEVLLNNGADENAQDEIYGYSPLYFLVQKNSPKTVQLLLNFKANYEILDADQRNLLFPAVFFSDNETVLQMLLDLGLNVNHPDCSGLTPLHYMASKNIDESHFKAAEILLAKGANVNAQDIEGRTPLHYLVLRGNLKMVCLFLNYGADINIVNDFNETALFPAVYQNGKNFEVAQLLVDLGLDINHRNNVKQTILHVLCFAEYADSKTIKYFLKKNADVNAVDQSGLTPLVQIWVLQRTWRISDKTIKSFLLLVEHSDFSNNLVSSIFDDDGRPLDSDINSIQIILKHLAKLQSLNIPVSQEILNKIQQAEFESYYEKCQEELLLARNTKLGESWITFYNILTNSPKKLKNYAGNETLIQDYYKCDCAEKFPIYGTQMIKNVNNGIERREMFDKSSIVLSNCLPIFNHNHLIIRGILDCMLSRKDLSKFCDYKQD